MSDSSDSSESSESSNSGVSERTRSGVVRPRATLASRTALLGMGLVLALIAGELFLQTLSLVASQYATRHREAFAQGDVIRVLCVGDSHTYGLPLPEAESYPAQLEQRLAALYPDRTVEVVNLGIPGLNSTFVKLRLERQLYQLDPDLVIVWVGINNLWNLAERGKRGDAGSGYAVLRWLQGSSRLFRLASIAWYNGTGHQYDPVARGGWYDPADPPARRLAAGSSVPNPAPGLAEDLEDMTRTVRALNKPILFVTYPLIGEHGISGVIQSTAARLGVEVVNTSADYRRAIRDGRTRAELIDERSGPHPSGLLYGYVVDSMLPRVTGSLAAWYGLRPVNAPRSDLASIGSGDHRVGAKRP